MADFLSISSACLSIVDATVRLSGRIKGVIHLWMHAPMEIIALHNELSDLAVVLDYGRMAAFDIQTTEIQVGLASTPNVSADLGRQLKTAEVILSQLDSFVNELMAIPKIKKRFRWVTRGSFASTKKDELRNVRMRINDIFAAYNSSTGGRIELQLRSVRAGVHDHMAITEIRFNKLQRQLVTIDQRIQDMAAETQNRLANSILPQMDQQNIGFTRLMGQMNTISAFIEGIHSRELSLTNDFIPNSRYRHPMQAMTITTQRRSSVCLSSCRCQCHMRRNRSLHWKLPSMLRGTLGSLFVGYSGHPIARAACDSNSCHQVRDSSTRLEASYIFPTWFLNYTFYMVLHKAATQLPTIILAFRQRVRFEIGGILHAAYGNNGDQVRALLQRNPDAINHMDEENGRSPLGAAFIKGSPEAVQILLNAGASLDTPDDVGISAGMSFAVGVLQRRYSDETRKALCRLVPVSRYIEDLELSPLMEVATGRRFERIASILDQAPELTVHTVDVLGRTALHRAAYSMNVTVAEELLLCGAAVDVVDRQGSTPLLYSLLIPAGSDLSLFRLLIRHGAAIRKHICDVHPLHIACQYGHLEAIEAIEAMLALGVPVDIRDRRRKLGATGVHYTIWQDKAKCLEILLRHGASMNPRICHGENALHTAVLYNSHGCLRVLLDAGADPSEVHTAEGRCIAHYATMVGNAETMRILSTHPLRGINLDARDSVDGSTAQELFSRRPGVTPELQYAFMNLVTSIRWANQVGTERGQEPQSETEDEEFYDAVTDF